MHMCAGPRPPLPPCVLGCARLKPPLPPMLRTYYVHSPQRQTARLADSCPSANERYRITRIVHKEYSYYKQ